MYASSLKNRIATTMRTMKASVASGDDEVEPLLSWSLDDDQSELELQSLSDPKSLSLEEPPPPARARSTWLAVPAGAPLVVSADKAFMD